MELEANISQRYPRIRQRQPTDPGLDDVLPKTPDQRVGLIGLELGRMLRERCLELR